MTYRTALSMGRIPPSHNATINVTCVLIGFLMLFVCFCSQSHMESEALTAAVPSFLYSCQPYFNQLEAAARSCVFQITPLPFDVYTRVKVF